MYESERSESPEQLLGSALEALDIPPELQAQAEGVYKAVGEWVMEHDAHAGRRDPEFYAQGSGALGTATMPVSDEEDWDLDAVYQRPIARESTTQERLKEEAGDVLAAFCENERLEGRPVPELVERDRCWRLVYPGFHLDGLPAIPERLHDTSDTSLLISDKDPQQREWIETNPKGYMEWFFEQMADTWEDQRRALAEVTKRDVEEVPRWEVRTVLQRAVQFARRNRDLDYIDEPDLKPASILLTTVAGLSYGGERSISEALQAVAAGLSEPNIVEWRGGELWVSNPTNPEENLARDMVGDAARTRRFLDWVARFQVFASRASDARGPQLNEVLAKALGRRPVEEAVERTAKARREQRESGKLWMAPGTGTLGAAGAVAVPQHTFHGDPEAKS